MRCTRRGFAGAMIAALVAGSARRARARDGVTPHENEVASARFSPDGSRVVTASGPDHRAIVWDAKTGEPLRALPQRWVGIALYTPDGRTIATAGYLDDNITGAVALWDAATGEARATLTAHGWAPPPKVRPLLPRALAVDSLRTSPDGRLLAAGTNQGTAVLWDLPARAERHVLREPLTPFQQLSKDYSSVHDLAFRPDGSRLATALTGGEVQVWDPAAGTLATRLKGHDSLVGALSWGPDGSRLASASVDGSAIVWDPAEGRAALTLAGHDGAVQGVAFSPDGRKLATAGADGSARIWDAASGRPLHVLEGHADLVHMAAWSPDGKRLATCSNDDTAAIWDGATGARLHRLEGHRGWVTQVGWSGDGGALVTASADSTAIVWDAATGRRRVALGRPREA